MAQLEPTKATQARDQLVYFVVEAEAAVVAAATTPTPPAAPAAGELYLQEAPAVAPVECPTPLVALVQTTVGPAIVGYWLKPEQQRLKPLPSATPSGAPPKKTPHKKPAQASRKPAHPQARQKPVGLV